jgi:hypothetical protein
MPLRSVRPSEPTRPQPCQPETTLGGTFVYSSLSNSAALAAQHMSLETLQYLLTFLRQTLCCFQILHKHPSYTAALAAQHTVHLCACSVTPCNSTRAKDQQRPRGSYAASRHSTNTFNGTAALAAQHTRPDALFQQTSAQDQTLPEGTLGCDQYLTTTAQRYSCPGSTTRCLLGSPLRNTKATEQQLPTVPYAASRHPTGRLWLATPVQLPRHYNILVVCSLLTHLSRGTTTSKGTIC